MSANKRGGKREGAGRKPSPIPSFLKKFRATDEEKQEFQSYMTGNSRFDFQIVLSSLRHRRRELKKRQK